MTNGHEREDLDGARRARLKAVADIILPGGRVPSAGDVGVSDDLIDRVLRADPALRGPLDEALSADLRDPAPSVADLQREHPTRFRALVLAVVAAYYLSPRAREAIGYSGQQPRTIDVFDLPSYMEDGSLDAIRERGPLYQDTDEALTRE